MEKYYFKMEPKEFVRKIIEIYNMSRKPYFYHPSVKRGGSRLSSGMAEDLLAYFLAVNLTGDYDFFVNQSITFNEKIEIKRKTVKPDTVLVKNNVIEHITDLKMDFGWKRKTLTQICVDANEDLKKIKGKIGNLTILNLDGITKEKKMFKLSDNLIFHIICVSSQNITKKDYDEHVQNIQNLKLENVKFYTLTSHKHPNIYGKSVEEILNSIIINDDEFIKLLDNLTN
jgi:hypothetical protein